GVVLLRLCKPGPRADPTVHVRRVFEVSLRVVPARVGSREKSEVSRDGPDADLWVGRADPLWVRRKQLVEEAGTPGIAGRCGQTGREADAREPLFIDRDSGEIVLGELLELRASVVMSTELGIELGDDAVEDSVRPVVERSRMPLVDIGELWEAALRVTEQEELESVGDARVPPLRTLSELESLVDEAFGGGEVALERRDVRTEVRDVEPL